LIALWVGVIRTTLKLIPSDKQHTEEMERTSMRQQLTLNRRHVLRGAGMAFAIPAMESLLPGSARGNDRDLASPKRFVAMCLPFGMHPDAFHPTDAGTDYAMPETLQPLESQRSSFTVFSHLDHGMTGGHKAAHTFLSGVKLEHAAAHPDGNIGLDQRLAESLAGQTRFNSVCLAGSGRVGAGWTRSGVAVPAIKQPSDAFRLLFVDDEEAVKTRRAEQFQSGGSVLDAVRESANSFSRRLAQRDQQKLDEYFTAVRDTEKRLQMSAQWLNRPKPTVDAKSPSDATDDFEEYLGIWWDVVHLALMTDSTRVVTLAPPIISTALEGVTTGYHGLSHHGQDPDLLRELHMVECAVLGQLGRFLGKLRATKQADGQSLLDSTIVLFGSGMGNGSRHDNVNLPLILAGGGFRHGRHIDVRNKQPLNSLYLSILHQFGIETDRFNTTGSTFSGLEVT
jgi:hypothetical protein